MNPGVYIFRSNELPLYVGSTADLDKRPVKRDRGHVKRYAAIIESDHVELIPCESLVKAQQMEEQLIRSLKPKYNTRNVCAQADMERTTRIIRENW